MTRGDSNKLNLVADENIPEVQTLFGHMANIHLLPGREVSAKDLKDCDLLLVRSVTKVNSDLLEGSSVRVVATATAGIDHIDCDYLKRNGVAFFNAEGCNANSVAEYVLSSLCSLALQTGDDVFEKKIAVVGYGFVGKALVRRLSSLGLNYCVFDPYLKQLASKDAQTFCDWREVLESEVISFHVPCDKFGQYPSFKMMDKSFFSEWRSPYLLINASRGDVCDDAQLLSFLAEKEACLNEKPFKIVFDVWQNEPKINPEVLSVANIATPHIAGYSFDAKRAATVDLQKKLISYLGSSYLDINDSSADSAVLDTQLLSKDKLSEPINGLDDELAFVVRAMLSVYDPLVDMEQLKFGMLEASSKRAQIFDGLRKNYRKRLECHHYTIEAEGLSESLCARLKALNFKLAL